MTRHRGLWRGATALTLCLAVLSSSLAPSAYAAAGQMLARPGSSPAAAPTVGVASPRITLTTPLPGTTLGSDLSALDLALPSHLPVAGREYRPAAFAGRQQQGPSPRTRLPHAAAPGHKEMGQAPRNRLPNSAAPAIMLPQAHIIIDMPKDSAVAPIEGPGRAGDSERIAKGLEALRLQWRAKGAAPEDSTGAFDSQSPANQLTRGPPGNDENGSEVPGRKDEDHAPASPPTAQAPNDNGGSGGKGWFGLGRTAVLFIASLLVVQFGVEAWSAAWAKWVQTNYGLDQYSLMTTVTMIVSLAAGFLGGWAADRIGLKKTYLISAVIGALTAAATLILFSNNLLPFFLLIALSSLRVFMSSAGRTAEQTIPIAIFKENKEGLVRYNSISQFILEIAGIAVPYSIGMMLGWWGAIGTMMLFPIAAVLAAALFLFFVKIPEFQRKAPAKGGAAALAGQAEEKHDPALMRIGSLGYPAFALLNVLLYGILALGYGNFVHPGATEVEQALAAGVAGKIVALYSLGGLFAALALSGLHKDLWRWVKGTWNRRGGKAAAAAEPAPESPDAALRSAMRWSFLGALGLLGFVPFLWTSPMIAALAMIPFGFTSVMGQLQLLSLVQANVKQEKKGKVMGGIRTVTTLIATGGILGFGQLFKYFPASAVPFWILLGMLALLGLYYVWVGLKLKRYLASHKR